jgi:hypothetical protein
MRLWNPALIVRLRASSSRRSIRTRDANLIARVHLLASARGALSSFATLAAAPLLREECRDPRIVDEVYSSGESCREDEVEEDPRKIMSVRNLRR